jgi:ubiquinone/menaquinone biosynthesis C-methylase UbiE
LPALVFASQALIRAGKTSPTAETLCAILPKIGWKYIDIKNKNGYDIIMDTMALIIDFFKDFERLGPGDDEQSKKALRKINFNNDSRILDVGCGTGAQSILLAKETNAEIIAVDFLQPFLDTLNKKIQTLGLNIKTICSNMDKLPFGEKTFDIIWSEGAIYNIGFKYGINYLKKFIKANGYLVITEMSWLLDKRPNELEDYWQIMYAGIDTIENKLQQLLDAGYKIIDYFILPNYCWDNYYEPIKNKECIFFERYGNKKEVIEFIEEGVTEREMYKKYNEYYGYVFYIIQNEM